MIFLGDLWKRLLSNCNLSPLLRFWESVRNFSQTFQANPNFLELDFLTEHSQEGLMLKLKLWYFGHLMRRSDSLQRLWCWKKIEGRSRRGWQRVRRLHGITDLIDMQFSKLWKLVMNKVARHATVNGFAKCQTWLCNWTTLILDCVL